MVKTLIFSAFFSELVCISFGKIVSYQNHVITCQLFHKRVVYLSRVENFLVRPVINICYSILCSIKPVVFDVWYSFFKQKFELLIVYKLLNKISNSWVCLHLIPHTRVVNSESYRNIFSRCFLTLIKTIDSVRNLQ